MSIQAIIIFLPKGNTEPSAVVNPDGGEAKGFQFRCSFTL